MRICREKRSVAPKIVQVIPGDTLVSPQGRVYLVVEPPYTSPGLHLQVPDFYYMFNVESGKHQKVPKSSVTDDRWRKGNYCLKNYCLKKCEE